MSVIQNNSLSYGYLNLNTIKFKNINSTTYLSSTFKIIYPFFFYYRLITNKIYNDSLFYSFSYFPNKYKKNKISIYYKNYNVVLVNRSFSYWLNNHLVCNRYNPYVLKNRYEIDSYLKYIYV